jgi:hypothetical protein
MQAFTQVIWLKEPSALSGETESDDNARPWVRAVAGAFALVLVVAFSAVVLSNFLN